MSGAEPTLALPPVLDIAAVAPLCEQLLALRGAPLRLDGSGVERLGGLGLQVLLAACRTWAEDGQPIQLAAPSPALADQLAAFGAADFISMASGEMAA